MEMQEVGENTMWAIYLLIISLLYYANCYHNTLHQYTAKSLLSLAHHVGVYYIQHSKWSRQTSIY